MPPPAPRPVPQPLRMIKIPQRRAAAFAACRQAETTSVAQKTDKIYAVFGLHQYLRRMVLGMKAPGLALVLLGVVAFALPPYRQFLPHIPLSDMELHLTAAGMFIAGAVMLLLVRNA